MVYIAANPPSPVPEEAEEEKASPRSEVMDYEVKISSAFDAVSNKHHCFGVPHENIITVLSDDIFISVSGV